MGRGEEDVVRIAKRLEKMVTRKSTDGALDLLKELQAIPMTLGILKMTRVGMLVNSLRKLTKDEEVISISKILIKTWKKLLGVDQMKRRSSQDSSSSSPTYSPVEMPEGSNSGPEGKHCERGGGGDRRRAETKPPSTPSTPSTPTTPTSPSAPGTPRSPAFPSAGTSSEVVREKCREMLAAALKTNDDYVKYAANCELIGAQIEDSIFQELPAVDQKYKNRVRSRISNLKDPKNPNLRISVLTGAISASCMAKMTAEEMASDELREKRKAMTEEAIRAHQMAKTGGTETDLFSCGKCRKKRCTYTQVQTRSADEPMTTFVFCNECGNRWKFC
ncbi:transcription elongation factor A protein 1-like [Petromyzon marinus]|uniref:Transcription elongation factor n=1 Tax=Petromyzon marinus TaxID=7757 RepID=A0AAJ7TJA7_PETMA|nr:transcription elongation factor A protein 2-like [Petromyzon marinus]